MDVCIICANVKTTASYRPEVSYTVRKVIDEHAERAFSKHNLLCMKVFLRNFVYVNAVKYT